MTEKEYMDRIKAVKKQLKQGKFQEAKKNLDDLYAYKPVRLAWFSAKARYCLEAEKNPYGALETLNEMHHWQEDYPGFRECMRCKTEAYRMTGWDMGAVWTEYCYKKACGKSLGFLDKALAEAVERYAEDPEDLHLLQALGEAYAGRADVFSALIVSMALARSGIQWPERGLDVPYYWLLFMNHIYLEERIRDSRPNTFILLMDEYQGRSLEVLGHLLSEMGHRVYLFSEPLGFETETELDLKDTAAVSMEQAQSYPDMCVVPPAALLRDGETYGDNRRWLIDHICREQGGRAVVLCSGHLWDRLYDGCGELRGRIGRLSFYQADYLEDNLHFGWAGDYLSYCSDLYGYDVHPDVYREPEVDFSILIPAKNSTATLRYTLQTCLNQRYTGSYEIVVSDNSQDGDPGIRELCESLGDAKIRYVKTPRNLSLTKSFEFGYLQTRGEFVLSAGSDDGVLPWALDTLKQALERFPEEDILLWDRGFYAWPGFNGGQQNQFIIPADYSKSNISVQYIDAEQMLEMLAQDTQTIYLLPLLYINSGFRRQYLASLLEKTGKLWDGPNQDMTAGIINCLASKRFLKICYPITIAGMSSSSIGALSYGAQDPKLTTVRQRIWQADNIGIYVHPGSGSLMYSTKYVPDALEIFRVLCRCVLEGLCTQEQADKIIGWKTAAVKTLEQCGPSQPAFDSLLFMGSYAAKRKGEEAFAWYQAVISRNHVLTPRYVDEAQSALARQEKTYSEGRNAGGGECLDASQYGVTNIAEAVELFAKRTGL